MKTIPLDQAERQQAGQRGNERQRPTVDGTRQAWLAMEGPTHAPSLAARPVPGRDWAVDGLVPTKAVTLLSGDGGSGKSTLTLQLACATVLGRRWLGRDARPGKAVYVSCEDDIGELHRRLDAMSGSEDWEISDLDGLELFDRVGRDNAVMYRGEGFGAGWEPSPFWVSLSNWLTDFGAGLVVLDSLYDFFPGNQLDMASARRFMGMLRELAQDAGCAIVVLWHPSKSGMESGDGTSGNVAFRNAARAMLYLERDKEATGPDAPLILRGKKSNYGPAAAELAIRWEMGRFVPVLPAGQSQGVVGTIAAEQAFLACLDAATSQGRFVSHSKGPSYAPAAFAKMPQASGFKAPDLTRAMERLFATGRIESAKVGTYANRTPRMGLARVTGSKEAQ